MVLQKYLKDTLLEQGLESYLITNKFSNELLISFLGSLGAAPLSDNSTELIHQIGRNVNYLGMQVILTKYENHFLFTVCQELGLSVPENQKQALINAICTLDDGNASSTTTTTAKAVPKKPTPTKPVVHPSPLPEIKKTTVVVSAAPVEKKIKSPKIHKEKKQPKTPKEKKKSKYQNKKNPKFLWSLCLL